MTEDENPSQIKYQLNQQQQTKLNNLFNSNDINQYFQSNSSSTIASSMLSSYYSDKILQGIQHMLNQGSLNLSNKTTRVQQLMDQPVINKEQQYALQLKAKKIFIEKQLQLLKQQTNPINNNIPSEIQGGLVLSKIEHKSIIKKIKQQRQQRQRRHAQNLALMQSKIREKYEKQKLTQEEATKKKLQQRRELIQKSLQKHKQQHENFIKIQKESKEKIRNIESHKFKYQQIEDQYQKNIVYQNLQEKKRKLKEIRQYRTFKIDEIKEHQRSYLQNRRLRQSRQVAHQNQWSYHPPPRSERLAHILEEERLQKIVALQQKKKQLGDKLAKQQEYVIYLRDNFAPRVDPAKREQLEKRIQKQKIVKPQPVDLRQIGISYLQQAKKLRKKVEKMQVRSQTQRVITNPVNLTNITIGTNESKVRAMTNYLTISNSNQHSQKRRRKKLQKLAKQQQISQAERIQKLRIQADKIGQDMRRKQTQIKYHKDKKLKQDALQLLLSSIQAKIGIIEMYN